MKLFDQSGELLAGIAGDTHQEALDQGLVWSSEASIAEMPEHLRNPPLGLVLRSRRQLRRSHTDEEVLDLTERLDLLYIHDDVHSGKPKISGPLKLLGFSVVD